MAKFPSGRSCSSRNKVCSMQRARRVASIRFGLTATSRLAATSICRARSSRKSSASLPDFAIAFLRVTKWPRRISRNRIRISQAATSTAAAQAFAREGARIGLIARGRAGLNGARRDVEELGGEALVLPLDVSDAAAVEKAAEKIEQKFGPIDVWVNNAMASVFSPITGMTAEEFKRVTEVTYLGYVYGTLAALRRMLPRNRGLIIQVGSALAYRGIPLQSAYCAAKHAIHGFVDSLRCELIHDKSRVRVVMIGMPAMNTPQFSWVKSRLPRKAQPVPPMFQPEIAAEAIVYASH